jgi:hypothetical protein
LLPPLPLLMLARPARAAVGSGLAGVDASARALGAWTLPTVSDESGVSAVAVDGGNLGEDLPLLAGFGVLLGGGIPDEGPGLHEPSVVVPWMTGEDGKEVGVFMCAWRDWWKKGEEGTEFAGVGLGAAHPVGGSCCSVDASS